MKIQLSQRRLDMLNSGKNVKINQGKQLTYLIAPKAWCCSEWKTYKKLLTEVEILDFNYCIFCGFKLTKEMKDV